MDIADKKSSVHAMTTFEKFVDKMAKRDVPTEQSSVSLSKPVHMSQSSSSFAEGEREGPLVAREDDTATTNTDLSRKDVPASLTNESSHDVLSMKELRQEVVVELARLKRKETDLRALLQGFEDERHSHSRTIKMYEQNVQRVENDLVIRLEELKRRQIGLESLVERSLARFTSTVDRIRRDQEDVSRRIERMELELRSGNEFMLSRVESLSKRLSKESERGVQMEKIMMSMVQDLCSKMTQGLRRERACRSELESKLMRVIGKVCSEVEGGLANSSSHIK